MPKKIEINFVCGYNSQTISNRVNLKAMTQLDLEKAGGEDLFASFNKAALDDLLPQVYAELKRLAAFHLKNERPDHTLRPTALVHEVYLQLLKQHSLNFQDRAYFLSIASTMMRRILVNYAKHRGRKKRGAGNADVALITLNEKTFIEFKQDIFDLLELERALNELVRYDARQVKIIELYFYGGLTYAEIAEVLGISLRTVMREWRFAKTWLYRKLNGAN